MLTGVLPRGVPSSRTTETPLGSVSMRTVLESVSSKRARGSTCGVTDDTFSDGERNSLGSPLRLTAVGGRCESRETATGEGSGADGDVEGAVIFQAAHPPKDKAANAVRTLIFTRSPRLSPYPSLVSRRISDPLPGKRAATTVSSSTELSGNRASQKDSKSVRPAEEGTAAHTARENSSASA